MLVYGTFHLYIYFCHFDQLIDAIISFDLILSPSLYFYIANEYHKKSLELRHSFTSQYQSLDTSVRSIIQNFTGEIWNCDDFNTECK